MLKSFLALPLAALGCCAAWAQQNTDTYVMFGNPAGAAYRIDGTSITAAGSHAFLGILGWGYQITRVSSASLWLDIREINGGPDDLQASVPGTGRTTWNAYTGGARLMVPVYRRISLYAATGVGPGLFHGVAVHDGPSPTVSTFRTFHGVFEFGGGLDFRLLRWFSLRAEVRDLVTGKQLGGMGGRQHVLPTFGFAFHY
jgi:hypothetical protein